VKSSVLSTCFHSMDNRQSAHHSFNVVKTGAIFSSASTSLTVSGDEATQSGTPSGHWLGSISTTHMMSQIISPNARTMATCCGPVVGGVHKLVMTF